MPEPRSWPIPQPYRGGANSDSFGSCADIGLAGPGIHGNRCCTKPLAPIRSQRSGLSRKCGADREYRRSGNRNLSTMHDDPPY